MEAGSGLYTSINAAHNGYSPKQIAWTFETANLRPAVYILLPKAVILNTVHAVYVAFSFCKKASKKCLVSETPTVLRTS
jgi:hypothetical protein